MMCTRSFCKKKQVGILQCNSNQDAIVKDGWWLWKKKFPNIRNFRYLTNEGIEYLRTYLHLPPEIVPATLKRQVRSELSRARTVGGGSRPEGGSNRPREDHRADYRRAPPSTPSDKKADVGAGTADLEFVSYTLTIKMLIILCLPFQCDTLWNT